ncbi:hypothetical protein LX32DRAFT_397723 [Colletotrichum zoysiae]|uniref:Uncharacterized protein n=1 Tax=Colletotrichum zoysiae TaxID=1216348 RepID=A0AAD9M921_9PEZI|nr:hypothetical protein LX32DRAFT_397723 [Colletotrichum zoysiae]
MGETEKEAWDRGMTGGRRTRFGFWSRIENIEIRCCRFVSFFHLCSALLLTTIRVNRQSLWKEKFGCGWETELISRVTDVNAKLAHPRQVDLFSNMSSPWRKEGLNVRPVRLSRAPALVVKIFAKLPLVVELPKMRRTIRTALLADRRY